jgi:hypothetical protein
VKASENGVDAVLARQLPHVSDDVHDARVAAPGQHDEAPAAHARHEGLVVENQRVRLPPSLAVCLMDREALLELRRPVHLAGHQQGPIEQEGRLPLLDDLEAGSLECAAARRGQLDGVAARQGHPAATPESGMDQDRHLRAPQLLDDAVHPGGVVPVAVAQDDGVDVARREAEAAHVLDEPVRVIPASKSTRTVRPDFSIVTRHENPCSARSASPVLPPSMKRADTLG